MDLQSVHDRLGPAIFYKLGFALLQVRRTGRRLQGRRRWAHHMAANQELGWSFSALQVPREADPAAARLVARGVCKHVARGCPWRYRWLRERLAVVRGAAQTYAGQRFGMSGAARHADTRALLGIGSEAQRAALSGADLQRVKAYWKLPLYRSAAEQWEQMSATLEGWLERHLPRGLVHICMARRDTVEHLAGPMLLSAPPAESDEFRRYVERLPIPTPSEVVIIEDKDQASGWLSSREGYLLRCIHFITHDAAWALTELTPEEAGRYLQAPHEPVVRARLIPTTSLERWTSGVPTLYCTQKAKCWTSGGRICSRAGHNCMRRICSWAQLPGRAALDRVGRAWRIAVQRVGFGSATASLTTAAADFRSRCGLLTTSADESRCGRCGLHKDPCSGVVADASAMYERVPADAVLLAASALVELLRRSGITSVLVASGRSLRGRLCAHPGAYIDGHVFVSLNQVLLSLRASLAVRFARASGR